MQAPKDVQEFIEFLKSEGYTNISYPLNTRHSDMYVAWQGGKRSLTNSVRKHTL